MLTGKPFPRTAPHAAKAGASAIIPTPPVTPTATRIDDAAPPAPDHTPAAGVISATAPDPDLVPLNDVLAKPAKKAAKGAKSGKPAKSAKPKAKDAPRTKRAAKESKPPKSGKAAKPAKTKKEPKSKKASGLDAAYQVLLEAKGPMTCGDMVQTMLDKAMWFTKGATPGATIYAAIIREIAAKGKSSRFKKTDRGLFSATTGKGA